MKRKDTSPQVIIVDDEEYILEFMKSDLQDHGLCVESFTCPHEAMEFVLAKGHLKTFENGIFLITDFRMPKLSGLELIEKLISKSIDIKGSILLTGLIPKEEMQRVEEMDDVEIMEKPVELDVIIKKIKSFSNNDSHL